MTVISTGQCVYMILPIKSLLSNFLLIEQVKKQISLKTTSTILNLCNKSNNALMKMSFVNDQITCAQIKNLLKTSNFYSLIIALNSQKASISLTLKSQTTDKPNTIKINSLTNAKCQPKKLSKSSLLMFNINSSKNLMLLKQKE